MKVVLLCAGYAVRLYPLTENLPKPLLPVGKRPILEWILEQLELVEGIDGVYIATNHKFASHFNEWKKGKVYSWPVEIVDDQTTNNENRLGAIGDLLYILKEKNIGVCDLMVIAGDNFSDFDLASFVKYGQEKRPHAVIAVYDVGDKKIARNYGLVKTSEDGRVIEFFEKPENPTTTLASCGIYWLPAETRVLLDRYVASGSNTDQPGHYMRWLSETASMFALPLKGKWLDIGDLSSYQKANSLIENS